MKKRLTLCLAFIVMLISSCQKNPNTGQVGGQDGMVDFSITTTLPQGPDAYTRAAANPNSALGGLANVNTETHDLRYIMEVWTIGDTPKKVYREVTTVANNWANTPATFDVRLIAQKYNFVFWADFVSHEKDAVTKKGLTDLHYTTTDLNNIVFLGDYKVSDDTRDAYFHKEEIDLSVSTNKIAVSLKRPFTKVRFIATDRPLNTNSNLVPTSSAIEYPDAVFYTEFNAITGLAMGTPSVRDNVGFLTATPTVEPTVESTAEPATDTPKDYLLVFDYILPGASVASIGESNISTMIDGVKAIRPNLPAIPIVANTLVTLKGNLYSNRGVVTVDVTDAFEEEKDVPVADIEAVESIGDVDDVIIKLAVENAATATPIGVKVETAVSVATTITVPATIKKETTPAITYDLSAGIETNQTLTIEAPASTTDGAADNYAGTINVIVPETNVGSVTINAPKAHVTINGKYINVISTTSSTTLVIETGTTIETLKVIVGRVEIYGTVGSLDNRGGDEIVIYKGGSVDTFVTTTTDIENCYIIAPSTTKTKFRFPAIDRVNEYWASGGTAGTQSDTYPYGYNNHTNAVTDGDNWYAEVIWSDIDASGVTFTQTSGNKSTTYNEKLELTIPANTPQGNIIIGLKDVNGLILWSWHIWISDVDSQNFAGTVPSGLKVMDRNLGAKSATPTLGTSLTQGLLYQWGRKDPIPGAADFGNLGIGVQEKEAKIYLAGSSTKTQYNNFVVVSNATLAKSIASPLTFYTAPNYSYYDWVGVNCKSHKKLNRWNNIPGENGIYTILDDLKKYYPQGQKTIFDPCPKGWRIPYGENWAGFTKATISSEVIANKDLRGCSYNGIWFPMTGWRKGCDPTNNNNELTWVGQYTNIWSSAQAPYAGMGGHMLHMFLEYGNINITPSHVGMNPLGNSVRPVKDTYNY